MADFFTADTHLGHANIIKYCQRPFMSIEEQDKFARGERFTPCNDTVGDHDEAILAAINKVVKRNDRLWIIGDFCWGGLSNIFYYREQIYCDNVNLIKGNHDNDAVYNIFTGVCDLHDIVIEGQTVVMCHYPMRTWNKSHHGSWHLFGHVHGNLEDISHHLALDVGVDTHSYKPWSWDEIKAYMEPRITLWKNERAKWKDKEDGGMKPGTHK